MTVGISGPGELLQHLHAVHHLPRACRILVEKIGQIDRVLAMAINVPLGIIGFGIRDARAAADPPSYTNQTAAGGYVEAKSNRPGEAPAINSHYLSEESGRRAIIGALRFARRTFATPALKQFVREESLPGVQVQTDDELLDYARRNGGSCYHASCTCMMGSHAMVVVDDELKVHGLDRLRVIDASVMPAVTSTNTNAPTIMIAEKGAAMIKGAARQRLAA
jgi:choline dehydrogenase-like flavoprotein